MPLQITYTNGRAHLLEEIRASAARLPPWRLLGEDRGLDAIARGLGAHDGFGRLADRAWTLTGPASLSQESGWPAPLRTVHFDLLEKTSDVTARLKLEICLFHMLVDGRPRDMVVLNRSAGAGFSMTGDLNERFMDWARTKDPVAGYLLTIEITEAALLDKGNRPGVSRVTSADRQAFDARQAAV